MHVDLDRHHDQFHSPVPVRSLVLHSCAMPLTLPVTGETNEDHIHETQEKYIHQQTENNMNSQQPQETHYDTLGLNHKASIQDIRAAYKHLSLTCHPDKIRIVATPGQKVSRAEEAQLKAHAQNRWAKIEQAHELLSDPITRAMYDIDAGFVANTDAEHARIARLKRKEAQVAVATMEETVAANRAEEDRKNGLLILAARYGDLSATDLDQSNAVSAPYIDVSVPLQCMVHDSALILAEGRSKFWLEGFYDPSMGASPGENRLYIRYRFLGQLHEAEFSDLEAVGIPLEEHCIEALPGEEQEGVPGGSSSEGSSSRGRPSMHLSGIGAQASRSAVAIERQKARRRTVLFGSVVFVGVAVLALKYKGVTMNQAKGVVGDWTQWIRQMLQEKMKTWQTKWTSATSSSSSASASTKSKSQPAVATQ